STDEILVEVDDERVIGMTLVSADEVLVALGEVTTRSFHSTDEALISLGEGGSVEAYLSRTDNILVRVTEEGTKSFHAVDEVQVTLGEAAQVTALVESTDEILVEVDDEPQPVNMIKTSSDLILVTLGEGSTFPTKITRASRLRATTRRRRDLDTHLQQAEAVSRITPSDETLDTPIEKEEKEEP
ncbi:MAG: hypothetical protein PHH09_12995, partial [Methanoregulaceae archaeon]|nr:hypothetical protein [Methanoregulaceae archaeon]